MIKVLIVEDDPMVTHLNKRYIEKVKGFNVVGTATNGEQALEFLINNSVDLIILDIYMPKLSGLEFLKIIRGKSIKSDVILVTAAREVESIDEAFKFGAVDYLIKPFEFDRLKEALDHYVRRRQFLKRTGLIEQEELDRITKKNNKELDIVLQKGLHKKTLELIRNYMRENADVSITSEDIALKLSVSRVTVRRYLEYLIELDEVSLEIEYGAIGRPSHLYMYKDKMLK